MLARVPGRALSFSSRRARAVIAARNDGPCVGAPLPMSFLLRCDFCAYEVPNLATATPPGWLAGADERSRQWHMCDKCRKGVLESNAAKEKVRALAAQEALK